ncbi:hypothetical protein MUY27_06685 [Mucilaginibacter sp. RS28]|uniref:Uncharacterized protein n=1 Tax=Mucilaginibacter straminoryzae TaxID=2932774 RepID=A0A9X1X678_9SPHI|nr:hypothetical protein [Mucilaginibacter straminoryzae]MCJ8209389.1 hypothetical protein [Mucilaginibacter straminoryzae]
MDKRIILLEFLEKSGFGVSVEISDLLMELFPFDVDMLQFDENKRGLLRLLSELIDEKLIHFDTSILFMCGDYNRGYTRWFNGIRCVAYIKGAGIAFLNNERLRVSQSTLNQSVIDTNSSVRVTNDIVSKSSKKQILIAGATAVFALFSFFVSLLQYQRDITKDQIRLYAFNKKQLDSLQTMITLLKRDTSLLKAEVKTLTKKK